MKSTSYFMMVTVGASASLSALVQLADAGRIESLSASQTMRATGTISSPAPHFRYPANVPQVRTGELGGLPGDTRPTSERPSSSIRLPGADAESRDNEAIQVEVELDGERRWIVIRKKPRGLPPELTEGAVVIAGSKLRREQVEYFFPGCKECGEGLIELAEPIALTSIKPGSANLRNIIATIEKDLRQKQDIDRRRALAERAATCQTKNEIENPKTQMKCIAEALASLEKGKRTAADAERARKLIRVFADRLKEECSVKKDRMCFDLITNTRLMATDHPMRAAADARQAYVAVVRGTELESFQLRDFKAKYERALRNSKYMSPIQIQSMTMAAVMEARDLQRQMDKPDMDPSRLAEHINPFWGLSEEEVNEAATYFAATYNTYAPLTAKAMPVPGVRDGREYSAMDPIAALSQNARGAYGNQTSQFQGMTIDPFTGAGLPGLQQPAQTAYVNPLAGQQAFVNNGVIPGLGSNVNSGQFNGLAGRGVVPGMNLQPGMQQQLPFAQQPGVFSQQPGMFAQQPGVFNQQPGVFGQPNMFAQNPAFQFQQNPMLGRPMFGGMPMGGMGAFGPSYFPRPVGMGMPNGFYGLNNGQMLNPMFSGNAFMGTPMFSGPFSSGMYTPGTLAPFTQPAMGLGGFPIGAPRPTSLPGAPIAAGNPAAPAPAANTSTFARSR